MDRASLTRTILALALIVNTSLTAFGLPVIGDELINAIVVVVGDLLVLWAIWKNNYLSKKGQAQAEVLERNGLK